MNNKIYLSSPHMGGGELKYIHQAFEENWIAPLGPNVDNFEKDICQYTGASHAAALSSGTAAIHLALILLGVQAGDEVICPTFTFSATVNPIVYQGAVPVFIDSGYSTWNICVKETQRAIEDRIRKGKKPKALMIVHLYGQSAKMDELMELATHYDIPVIEDAAEALGAQYKGKMLGTFGKFGILSFNGNKIITTSGGGALLSHEEDLIKKARFLATQARDNAPHYQHSQIGYNYRLSNIAAGIGRGQMEVIAERVKQRRAHFEFYKTAFAGIPAISFSPELENTLGNRWLTCIVVDEKQSGGVTRETIRLALEKQNIEARPLWKPMHLQPIFANYPYYGSRQVAEDLFTRGLCLPSGSNLSTEDLAKIATSIKHLF
ncbi:aminotransferase class I/II-fold pyridoxal phosphate-dependent enzyme [Rhodocytophaga aerolata]|uniref:Aminotransferase class I/II-fold pyridoxal phosphate-dependent enzyme n=1 Tax=Rhodocytophaga aerolata TaxID=455078 RepID=A0ABT8R2J6_9BACT|nr:aminotransferase class I/II-fold pyridoxal phosphate-dependent enzyme [Rhodocytophaga aerolata]MDO1446149.1 aminotransferase class I/II-fold pyridoxal phosphate-dependent enzyme [Rhodocytophaga aerolata]